MSVAKREAVACRKQMILCAGSASQDHCRLNPCFGRGFCLSTSIQKTVRREGAVGAMAPSRPEAGQFCEVYIDATCRPALFFEQGARSNVLPAGLVTGHVGGGTSGRVPAIIRYSVAEIRVAVQVHVPEHAPSSSRRGPRLYVVRACRTTLKLNQADLENRSEDGMDRFNDLFGIPDKDHPHVRLAGIQDQLPLGL